MDGYAARGEDVRGASPERPVRLRVVEQLPAGTFPTRAIGPGECARIFTGAPLPDGADTVIRQEDTDQGTDTVTITQDRDAGANVRLAGEDIARGTTVLRAGAELGPAAARRARLPRGRASAGLPAAPGRHPRQRRRDRGRRPGRTRS